MANVEKFIASLYGDRGKPAVDDPARLISEAAADAGVSAVPVTTAALHTAATALPVSTALWRRGALLFQLTGSGSPRVAVSLGNGDAIESRSPAYGITLTDTTPGQPWTAAGWLPGIEA